MHASADNDLETVLAILSKFAIWSRDVAWAEQWFENFLTPLFAEGLFLPPLLAFDLRSAAEPGDRRFGELIERRENGSSWKKCMSWMHAVIFRSLPTDASDRTEARNSAALRLAHILALNLMARTDVSTLRFADKFDPRAAVNLENQRLEGKVHAVAQLGPVWKIIDELVKSERFNDLIPFCESHAACESHILPVDPFLRKLLYAPQLKHASLPEPQIPARTSKADNSRKFLANAGEFARRDIGGLPDNLGRLAPTELLLLLEAFERDAGSNRIVDVAGFRTLFLLRASQSGLWQRFHYNSESARTRPAVSVEIELTDDPDDHRLSDPPRPPTISYYRAVVVHLFHQIAQLAATFQWSLQGMLVHNMLTSRCRSILDRPEMKRLAISTEDAFQSLTSQCPSVFAAARSRQPSQGASLADPEGEFDLAVRIIVGPIAHDGENDFSQTRIRSGIERSVRVERRRDGRWGWSAANSYSDIPRLDEARFLSVTDNPAIIAAKLILEAFDMESKTAEFEV